MIRSGDGRTSEADRAADGERASRTGGKSRAARGAAARSRAGQSDDATAGTRQGGGGGGAAEGNRFTGECRLKRANTQELIVQKKTNWVLFAEAAYLVVSWGKYVGHKQHVVLLSPETQVDLAAGWKLGLGLFVLLFFFLADVV